MFKMLKSIKLIALIIVILNLISCGEDNKEKDGSTVSYSIKENIIEAVSGNRVIKVSLSKIINQIAIEKIAKKVKKKSQSRNESIFISFYIGQESAENSLFALASFDPNLAVLFSNENQPAITPQQEAFENRAYLAKLKGIVFSSDTERENLYKASLSKDQDVSKRTKAVIANLRRIPASKLKENYNLYKELYFINSYNAKYLEKAAFYQDKIYKQAAQEVKLKKLKEKWSYVSYKDDMTGKPVKFSRILTDNTFNFRYPYSGIQYGKLKLRTHPTHGQDVILSIKKGQFICASSGCRIKVKFDNNSPVNWRANGPSDYSTTSLFLSKSKTFLKRLKKAKSIIIQANIYKEGSPVFKFSVAGFELKRHQRGK